MKTHLNSYFFRGFNPDPEKATRMEEKRGEERNKRSEERKTGDEK
jgi:hypothetical protein